MGKPFMIQEEDNEQIELLKKKMGAKTKIDVVRAGLRLLDQAMEKEKRIERWKSATRLIVESSKEINKDFQKHSLLKRS